jgi:Bromodomain
MNRTSNNRNDSRLELSPVKPVKHFSPADFEVTLSKDHKTTAWREAKPICEKIIEALMQEPGGEYFCQPPK